MYTLLYIRTAGVVQRQHLDINLVSGVLLSLRSLHWFTSVELSPNNTVFNGADSISRCVAGEVDSGKNHKH